MILRTEVMKQNIVKTGLTRSKNCKKAIATYSNYRVFWRSGFAYRGAGEREIKREGQRTILCPGGFFLGTFDDELQLCFNWACALDMVIDHDKKEIHINGFSENDMY